MEVFVVLNAVSNALQADRADRLAVRAGIDQVSVAVEVVEREGVPRNLRPALSGLDRLPYFRILVRAVLPGHTSRRAVGHPMVECVVQEARHAILPVHPEYDPRVNRRVVNEEVRVGMLRVAADIPPHLIARFRILRRVLLIVVRGHRHPDIHVAFQVLVRYHRAHPGKVGHLFLHPAVHIAELRVIFRRDLIETVDIGFVPPALFFQVRLIIPDHFQEFCPAGFTAVMGIREAKCVQPPLDAERQVLLRRDRGLVVDIRRVDPMFEQELVVRPADVVSHAAVPGPELVLEQGKRRLQVRLPWQREIPDPDLQRQGGPRRVRRLHDDLRAVKPCRGVLARVDGNPYWLHASRRNVELLHVHQRIRPPADIVHLISRLPRLDIIRQVERDPVRRNDGSAGTRQGRHGDRHVFQCLRVRNDDHLSCLVLVPAGADSGGSAERSLEELVSQDLSERSLGTDDVSILFLVGTRIPEAAYSRLHGIELIAQLPP